MLIDDESDLIYHIVCSREGPEGAPAEGFNALDCWWFTNDRHTPLARELPPQHDLIFTRSSEFSSDALRFKDRILTESYPLMKDEDIDLLPRGVRTIEHVFRIADFLAIYYQKMALRILRTTHFLAFLMGFMFILFSDLRTQPIFICDRAGGGAFGRFQLLLHVHDQLMQTTLRIFDRIQQRVTTTLYQ